ncbi:MAG: histidine kinase [Methylacidiphilales bacterium]|nr:histidine kinase [Candidatus Methylacidiphilales bacterium]
MVAEVTSFRLRFPNFCSYGVLFPLLLTSGLVAFLVVLSGGSEIFWSRLSVTLFTYVTVVVLSCWLLCMQSNHLRSGTLLSQCLIVYVTCSLVTAISVWVTYYLFAFLDDGIWFDIFTYTIITGIAVSIMLRALYLRCLWEEHIKISQNVRLQSLQTRIQPHFLFNCLNSLNEMILNKPKVATEMVYAMSELFRSSFNPSEKETLGTELELVQRYLFLEKIRLQDRLQIVIEVAEDHKKIGLIAFILQPIVENAIQHGIEPSVSGGKVSIHSSITKGRLIVEVRNEVRVSNNIPKSTSGNQFALGNIKERLRLAYGEGSGISIRNETSFTSVTITIPII